MSAGGTAAELDWLVQHGHVEARTSTGQPYQQAPESAGTLPPGALLALLARGAVLAAQLFRIPELVSEASFQAAVASAPRRGVPVWDRSAGGRLSFNGVLLRQYRRVAPKQWPILDAFERQDWPTFIDNPLPAPANPLVAPRKHWNDQVSNLNREHKLPLIHFWRDEVGRIGWRLNI